MKIEIGANAAQALVRCVAIIGITVVLTASCQWITEHDRSLWEHRERMAEIQAACDDPKEQP